MIFVYTEKQEVEKVVVPIDKPQDGSVDMGVAAVFVHLRGNGDWSVSNTLHCGTHFQKVSFSDFFHFVQLREKFSHSASTSSRISLQMTSIDHLIQSGKVSQWFHPKAW